MIVTRQPSTPNKLDFSHTELSEKTIEILSAHANKAIEIDLSHCIINDNTIFAVLGTVKKITTLNLSDTPLSISQFTLLLNSCRNNIENLLLTNTINFMKRYQDPATQPKDHIEIKEVIAEQKATHTFAENLGIFANKLFSLSSQTSDKKPALLPAGDIAEDNHIISLNTAVPSKSSAESKQAVASIKTLSNINTYIDLSGIAMQDLTQCFIKLGEWLSESNKIQTLTLNKNIGDSARQAVSTWALEKFTKGLKKNTSLQSLDLSENNIDHNGFNHIFNLITSSEHPPIHTLILNENDVANSWECFKNLFLNPNCMLQHISFTSSRGLASLELLNGISTALNQVPNHTLISINSSCPLVSGKMAELCVQATIKDLCNVLQDNHTLRTITMDKLYPEIDELLQRNQTEQTIKPKMN